MSTETSSSATPERVAVTSAWLLYTLIVLEILFMVSPFAAYYYAAYATPLNALQSLPQTAWLTMYVLPHFAYSESWLANGLILISWPLIGLGVVLFLIGFGQIYWAKFTSRAAVAVGLYKYIRHPQYVALAIVGLGTTLFWSRFIVGIAYATMLFLYFFLARLEERICLRKFGDDYARYMARTGMFLPLAWEQRIARFSWALPRGKVARLAALGALYLGTVGLVIVAGFTMRAHVLDSLQVVEHPSRTVIFLAPFDANTRAQAAQVLAAEVQAAEGRRGGVAYVAPASWQVPELGLQGDAGYQHGGVQELMHPTTHGNSFDFDATRIAVLLAEPVVGHADTAPRLSRLLGIKPISIVEIDLQQRAVVNRRPAAPGRWAGIPVPVF
ncbi:MAG: isoprenylcysteine carboxylmethyltransferase family protein [Pseudomonadales bacterium]